VKGRDDERKSVAVSPAERTLKLTENDEPFLAASGMAAGGTALNEIRDDKLHGYLIKRMLCNAVG